MTLEKAIHEVTTLDEFEAALMEHQAGGKPLVVDYTTDAFRCPECIMMDPTFEILSDEYGGRASFLKVDIETNRLVAAVGGVSPQDLPVVQFYSIGGNTADYELSGFHDKRTLADRLDQYLM